MITAHAIAADGNATRHVHHDAGDNQLGIVNQPLPFPLAVAVTDEGHNRLPGEPVTFTVQAGGGDFAGQPSVTVLTDAEGFARATFTLGPTPGIAEHVVVADTPGNTGALVTFVASAVTAGDPAQTSVSGVVLDNTNIPVPGVTVSINGTALAAPTDAEGRFFLQPAPVGTIHLHVDGTTATRPGDWASLEFVLVTVPGRDNTLGMPIFILPIDLPNSVHVSETEGGTVTLPGIPGFSLEIAPGSATFPGGGREGDISVTLVHADKVPMTPNFSQQPRVVVTVQPPGVHFDPPAKVSYPNLDGEAPGATVELYSFDHDLNRFVSTGTGTVSEDGTTVVSDPGVGIAKAGWQCAGNPAPTGQCQPATVTIMPNPIVIEVSSSVPVSAAGAPGDPGSPPFQWSIGDTTVVDFASAPTSVGQLSSGTLLAAAEPGKTTAQVKYRTDNGSEASAVADVKVGLPYEIRLSAFIPFNNVLGIPCLFGDEIRLGFFSGDDRDFDFDGSFRAQQNVTVLPEGVGDPTKVAPTNLVGETKLYASDSLDDSQIDPSDDDGVLGDCSLLHDRRTAPTDGMAVLITRRGEDVVEIRMTGEATNPFPDFPPSPAISWDLTLTIDVSDSSRKWDLKGDHDGFPAYELYMNRQQLYGFDPRDTGQTVLSLFPPKEINVMEMGDLP